MSKRELERLAVVVDAGAPRAKRRRETTDEKPDVRALEAAAASQETTSEEARAKVKEEGLQLWQTVKDAVNKECVTEPISVPDLLLCLHYSFEFVFFFLFTEDAPSPQSFFVFLPNDNMPTITRSSRNPSLWTKSRLSSVQESIRSWKM